jgi:hypothetical protein
VSDLFATGRIVDVILVLVVIEWIALVVYHRLTGRGIATPQLTRNLLAGAFLLLALRGALKGVGWTWIGLALTAALFAHLGDLRRRWQE